MPLDGPARDALSGVTPEYGAANALTPRWLRNKIAVDTGIRIKVNTIERELLSLD